MGFLFGPIITVAINGLSLYLLTLFVEGITYTGGLKLFVMSGIVLGLINFCVKPLLKIVSLPFVILTGGLFLVVINMGILWFLSYFFSVIEFRDITLSFQNFSTYVIGAVVFGIINWLLNLIK